jgi:hypothetical protein
MIKIFLVTVMANLALGQPSRVQGSNIGAHFEGQWAPKMWHCPGNPDCDKILAQAANANGDMTVQIRPSGLGRMAGSALAGGRPSVSECCRRTQEIQKTVLSKLMELYRSPVADGSWNEAEVKAGLFEPRIFEKGISEVKKFTFGNFSES